MERSFPPLNLQSSLGQTSKICVQSQWRMACLAMRRSHVLAAGRLSTNGCGQASLSLAFAPAPFRVARPAGIL
eukprot:2632115-Pyramimonas_sp.AAC.1